MHLRQTTARESPTLATTILSRRTSATVAVAPELLSSPSMPSAYTLVTKCGPSCALTMHTHVLKGICPVSVNYMPAVFASAYRAERTPYQPTPYRTHSVMEHCSRHFLPLFLQSACRCPARCPGRRRTLQVTEQLLVGALEAGAQHRAQLHRAAQPGHIPLCSTPGA